jgi:hypothetical protein
MKINNFATLLKEYKVVIPPIQRDYAQGRDTNKVNRIRSQFLETMTNVLCDDYQGPPLKLDFIYGYMNKDKSNDGSEFLIFKPLDGQQRLTTLFLLHWFVAIREKQLDAPTKSILANFSYATRAKSRQFCKQLVEFEPELGSVSVKSQIENQPWFFLSWASDPTISSMLIVLDAMETKFGEKGITGAWEKLLGYNPPIIFYLLEMEDLGLPDELYIKMNSRGKELTDFEHFKSQFSRILNAENEKIFKRKIDKAWSDLFWDLFKDSESDNLAFHVDTGFLNFFWYVTDLLIVKNEISNNEDDYWLTIIESVYKNADSNVAFLFSCLDLFTDLEKNHPQFFQQLFYKDEYESGKTRLFFNNVELNLFRKCATNYDTTKRANPFSVGEQLMLYACIIHKLNDTENFANKIREIRNLIASSEDQIRKEYLGSLYLDIENIVRDRPIGDKPRFSKTQLSEELSKRELREESPELSEIIFKLEDHRLLRGALSIFTIDNKIEPYALKFQEVFEGDCDYYQISRAMLTVGDYSQIYGRLRRLGSNLDSGWRELFTPSESRKDFGSTKQVLQDYLQLLISDNSTSDSDLIAADSAREKDWKYYYIKYENLRKWCDDATEGFYHWDDFENKPFEYYMMYRKQFNGRHWNPFLLEITMNNSHCSIKNYGNNIQFTLEKAILSITMDNNSFIFKADENDTDSNSFLNDLKKTDILNQDGCLLLKQISAKEDAEDRIETCLATLDEIETLSTTPTN